jgi:hypothetical protein
MAMASIMLRGAMMVKMQMMCEEIMQSEIKKRYFERLF